MDIRPNAKISIRRAGGFTIIELLTGLAVASVATVIITAVITGMMSLSLNSSDKIDSERLLLEATYHITNILSRGVNVALAAGNLNAYQPGTTQGALIPFTGNSIAGGLAGTTATIAVFNFENAPSTPGTTTSSFQPAGLFYQMPTPNSSGALYLDSGINAPKLIPNGSTFLIDRVVRFNVLNIQVGPQNQVLSAQFDIAVRYFTDQNSTQAGSWCPPADMGVVGGCNKISAYRDIETNFQVALLDNSMPTNGTGVAGVAMDQGSQGPLYYFRMLTPMGL